MPSWALAIYLGACLNWGLISMPGIWAVSFPDPEEGRHNLTATPGFLRAHAVVATSNVQWELPSPVLPSVCSHWGETQSCKALSQRKLSSVTKVSRSNISRHWPRSINFTSLWLQEMELSLPASNTPCSVSVHNWWLVFVFMSKVLPSTCLHLQYIQKKATVHLTTRCKQH